MLQSDAALSGPGLPGDGVAHVLDVPAAEEGLAHDLLIRQVVHGNQSVEVQLAEGVYVGCPPLGRVNGCGAEAGEGQVSAELPEVLLLRGCADELLCCEVMESQMSKKVLQGVR